MSQISTSFKIDTSGDLSILRIFVYSIDIGKIEVASISGPPDVISEIFIGVTCKSPVKLTIDTQVKLSKLLE